MNSALKTYKKSFLERAIKNTTSHSIRLNYAYKRALTRRGKWLFITCTPKSGSTFLARCLSIATGFKEYKLTEDVHKENDLYLPRLIDAYNMNLVCRQHTRANPLNLVRSNEFGMRTVVLTRNLADSVISARDYIAQNGVLAGLSIPDPFRGLSEEQQYDFVIDLFMPWYIDFLVGWHRASVEAGVPVLWVKYEKMLTNKSETVRRVLDYFDVTKLKIPIEDAIEAADGKKGTNFNVGAAGRGKQKLSPTQFDRLERLMDWIPPEVRDIEG